jgi:DNA-binding LacI/PurR family transcriptional regulator
MAGCGSTPPRIRSILSRARQLRRFDGLQQVVDRIHAEGVQSIAVIGGGEDDQGLRVDVREHLETGHARHFDVEEEHVGPGGDNKLKGFRRIAALSSDFDAASGRQH